MAAAARGRRGPALRLQTALRAQNRRPFLPHKGLRPVELAQRPGGWQQRLLQLGRLEAPARRLQHQAALRESFLTDTDRVLDRAAAPPASPATAEVAARRLGMQEAGILPQEGRFQALAEAADPLQQEQYHRWADVACR